MSTLKLKPGTATMHDLVDTAQAALDGDSMAAHQLAFNALSTAAWHIARGEAPQALARMRRARSHIMATMEASKPGQADSDGGAQS